VEFIGFGAQQRGDQRRLLLDEGEQALGIDDSRRLGVTVRTPISRGRRANSVARTRVPPARMTSTTAVVPLADVLKPASCPSSTMISSSAAAPWRQISVSAGASTILLITARRVMTESGRSCSSGVSRRA